MDRVFQTKETEIYERWLASPAGVTYLDASRRLVERVLDCRPGWRVLDVGCGLGSHLAHLRERGMMVHGLEAGPVMARLASQALGPKVEVDLGDAHDLPYEDNSFDAVIMVNTLELLDRPAQALAEAVRVAVSRVCLITLNPLSPVGAWWRLRRADNPLGQGRAMAPWTVRRLVREVLGPVPQAWAGATLWPRVSVGPWPLAGLLGVCAAVTPRFRTRPLTVKAGHQRQAARPAHGHGRVILLPRQK
jgi:SAM-dependent methyltransferase